MKAERMFIDEDPNILELGDSAGEARKTAGFGNVGSTKGKIRQEIAKNCKNDLQTLHALIGVIHGDKQRIAKKAR